MTSNRPLGCFRRRGAHGKEGHISGSTSSRNRRDNSNAIGRCWNKNWRSKKVNEILENIGKIDERNKDHQKMSFGMQFSSILDPFWKPNASRTRSQKGSILGSKKGTQKHTLKATPGGHSRHWPSKRPPPDFLWGVGG